MGRDDGAEPTEIESRVSIVPSDTPKIQQSHTLTQVLCT